ncbi:MAG: EamA/RhaT family transporter [Flavobacterium sp.]
MTSLFISIACSVAVGAVFKVARKYNSKDAQIVFWNYFFAILLCYLVFAPDFSLVNSETPWILYGALGILLPTVFIVLAISIKNSGIVKTDAAQRMSLFLSLIGAWLIFNEAFSTYKIVAVVVALIAFLLILDKPSKESKSHWIYPALVLLGYATIDLLFKQLAGFTTLPYTASLLIIFGIAIVIMFVILIVKYFLQKEKIESRNILFGAIAGVLNFGNILFYLKAHQQYSDNPSTVFLGMNVGVIVLGSLMGIFIFKEKLSIKNYIGIGLGIIAIVFVVLSQN